MIVNSLEFSGYRNLLHDTIIPSEGINVICGNNAQGKTNFIECLWLFTGARSFRGSKDSELVAFGEKEAKIKLCFFSQGREQTIEINIRNGKRTALLNDVPKGYMSQITGSFCAVVFSPDHLTLIKNGPEERRSFIDAALCQIRPNYALVLSRYKKLLNERNALLKDIPRHRKLEDTLDIWNERLAAEGSLLAVYRTGYIRRLRKYAGQFYEGISDGREKLDIEYIMNSRTAETADQETIKNDLLQMLRRNQSEDIYCGYTTAGVHRDDLSVRINGKEARSYGSQGQQRSAVLSLKLAEASVLGDEKGEKPVILLDDVLSELDASRQDYLLRRLSGMQVFITCCEGTISAENMIRMDGGKIKPEV